MASMYRRGRNFEYRTKKLLESRSWFVTRSAASKGLADLVGIFRGKTYLIQCKLNGSLSPEEWNQLYDNAKKVGAVPVLAKRSAKDKSVVLMELISRKGDGHWQPMKPLEWENNDGERRPEE